MDPSLVVGPDYVHRLAGACQRFVGAVCVAEPDVFRSAVRELTAHLPEPDTSATLLLAWALLESVVTRGARTHDAQFHRCFGGACQFQPAAGPPLETSGWSVMRQRINDWAEMHANAFDRAHRWPAAAKAAAALRRQPQRASYTADLARAVGASCSTLERGFTTIYGTTPGHYHTMVRIRHTVEAVRRDSGTLEGVTVEAGWAGINAFARALRTVTDVKPSMLRKLPDGEYATLVHVQLTLPVPKPV